MKGCIYYVSIQFKYPVSSTFLIGLNDLEMKITTTLRQNKRVSAKSNFVQLNFNDKISGI